MGKNKTAKFVRPIFSLQHNMEEVAQADLVP